MTLIDGNIVLLSLGRAPPARAQKVTNILQSVLTLSRAPCRSRGRARGQRQTGLQRLACNLHFNRPRTYRIHVDDYEEKTISNIVKILGYRKIIDKLDVGLIPNQAFPSKARGDQRMCLTHFVQTPVTRFFLFFFFTRFKFEILYTHLSSSNYKSLEIRTQIWVN